MPHHTASAAHPTGHSAHDHTLSSPSTQGPLVHDAVGYDQTVRTITHGRQRQFRKQMADLLHLREGDAVLDVGCGTGDLALELAKRVGASGKVVGVDGSEEMIARARQKARRRRLAIEFQVQMAEAISLPNQRFDWVVSSLVFHSLLGAQKLHTLGAIARVLKADGHLLIIDFLDADGFVLTHAAQPADVQSLPTLLRHVGFEPVQSGSIPFKTEGIPPLGYVSARLLQPGNQ